MQHVQKNQMQRGIYIKFDPKIYSKTKRDEIHNENVKKRAKNR